MVPETERQDMAGGDGIDVEEGLPGGVMWELQAENRIDSAAREVAANAFI